MLVRGLMDPLAAIRRLEIGMHSFQKSNGLQSSKTERRRHCAKAFHAKQRHVFVRETSSQVPSPARAPTKHHAGLQSVYVGPPPSSHMDIRHVVLLSWAAAMPQVPCQKPG